MQLLLGMELNPYQSPTPEPVDDDGRLRSFRLAREFKYAAEYRPALLTGVAWQVALFVLTLLLLDGGRIHAVYWLALVVQWAITGFILTLAPQTPSARALAFIRYGILLLTVVAIVIAPYLPPPLVPSDDAS